MKEHLVPSDAELLLKKALHECLEEEIRLVPTESEIGQMHVFSDKFEKDMNALQNEMEKGGKEAQKPIWIKYSSLAACALVLLVCLGVLNNIGTVQKEAGVGSVEAPAAAAAFDMRDAAMEEASDIMEVCEESAAEEEMEMVAEYAETEDRMAQKSSAAVTASVSFPNLEEHKMCLTIRNETQEDTWYEKGHYPIEVLKEGKWQAIPYEETEETVEILKAGMSVDLEIDLEGYEMNPEEMMYRLILYAGDEILYTEFTYPQDR